MTKYIVYMSVHGTAVVEIEADSPEQAKEKAAEEYSETNISICNQCSDKISDPCYGDAVEAIEATP